MQAGDQRVTGGGGEQLDFRPLHRARVGEIAKAEEARTPPTIERDAGRHGGRAIVLGERHAHLWPAMAIPFQLLDFHPRRQAVGGAGHEGI